MKINPREFFYKGYYKHKVQVENELVQFDLNKPLSKEAFGEVKKKNKPVITDANKRLRDFALTEKDFHCLKLNSAERNRITDFPLTTTYPGLLIGTGYTHQSDNEAEFKLGFYFDYTTGLPCIPGSSVKGVLRSAFPQLGSQLFSAPGKISEIEKSKIDFISKLAGWETDEIKEKIKKVHQLELAVFEGVDLEKSNEKSGNEYKIIYERVHFYNAYISRSPERKIFETDAITPHGDNPLKNPVPLNFLKIRPGVEFTFQFQLQDFDSLGLKKSKLREMFINILKYTGAGAKTNVGYGQFI